MFVLSLVILHVMAQASLPQWAKDLVSLNPGVIDSVVLMPVYEEDLQKAKMTMDDIFTTSYMIYYHQPRKHSEPDGEQFALRATMTVYDNIDPLKAVNQVFIGGYALPKWWIKEPDICFAQGTTVGAEITERYLGNYIFPEYRYFQYSAPEKCYEKLEDLRSEEAAEDFHNLFEALKKVLKGKWAISGGSKGGEAALLQHAFHPEDADAFVPYVAPFFNTTCDTTMQHYWLTTGWNKEYRDMLMGILRTFTARMENIYPLYQKLCLHYKFPESKIYSYYLSNAAHFGFAEHVNSDTAGLREALNFNSSMMYQYNVKDYNDSVYAILLIDNSFRMTYFGERLAVLRGVQNNYAPSLDPMPRMMRHQPRGVTEAEWWGNESIGKKEQGYEYQSKVELGYYDLRFDDIVGAEAAPGWNKAYKQYVGNLRDYYNPYYKDFPFDGSLYEKAVTTTKNATKPIIFIYGEDDPWTGAAMKDEYINGTNVRKFILPGQNHSAGFASDTDKAKCNAIRAMLDDVFGPPQGIESVSAESAVGNSGQGIKIMQDGQLFILLNGKRYSTLGQPIE